MGETLPQLLERLAGEAESRSDATTLREMARLLEGSGVSTLEDLGEALEG